MKFFRREEVIQLDDFQNQEILIKFVTTNLRGNNIFIDDIEINNNISHINNYTNEIILYPNPSKGSFIINCPKCINKQTTITVRNLLGDIVLQKKYKQENLKVELSGYENGIYFLEIEDKIGTSIYPIIKI